MSDQNPAPVPQESEQPAESRYPKDYQPTDPTDPAPADEQYGPDYVAPSSQAEADSDPDGPDTAAEVVDPLAESDTPDNLSGSVEE